MFDKNAFVMTSEYRREATKWLQAIKRRENVSVVFFPKTDRLRRFQQFIEDAAFIKKILGKKDRFFFQVFDLDPEAIEDKQSLSLQVAKLLNSAGIMSRPMDFAAWVAYLKKNQVTLVLMLPQAEKYLTAANARVLGYLSELVDTFYPRVTTVCFFEVDMVHSIYTHVLPASTRLYQNIYYYPLYSPEDAKVFIQFLSKKWKVPVSKKMEQLIVEKCGGHFWFIKEALRQVIEKNPNPFGSEGMVFRLRTVYDFFLPSEQSLLKKIIAGKSDYSSEEKESFRYFQRVNFVDFRGRCLVPLYYDFLVNSVHVTGEIAIRDGKIFLNNVPIDQMFSQKERRVFRVFLSKRGDIVTREEIASALWPTQTKENYSDWAIDQMIARLRKRLIGLSLPPKLLQVVRGKGYLLNLQDT